MLVHEDLSHGLGKYNDVVETARSYPAGSEWHIITRESIAADYQQTASRSERIRVRVPDSAGVEVQGSECLVTFFIVEIRNGSGHEVLNKASLQTHPRL